MKLYLVRGVDDYICFKNNGIQLSNGVKDEVVLLNSRSLYGGS